MPDARYGWLSREFGQDVQKMSSFRPFLVESGKGKGSWCPVLGRVGPVVVVPGTRVTTYRPQVHSPSPRKGSTMRIQLLVVAAAAACLAVLGLSSPAAAATTTVFAGYATMHVSNVAESGWFVPAVAAATHRRPV